MEHDPRNQIIRLYLLGGGEVLLPQQQLEGVSEYHHPPRLEIQTGDAGTFNVCDNNGLYPKLMRIIADCHEYQAAADEVAAETEARIK